jgi:4-amino-4-deoxy-L-arabinose transferase-like glycosyltransferase
MGSAAASLTRRRDRLHRTVTLACFGALGLVLILHAQVQHIDQDEEQYVAGAYLAQSLHLYADFLYFQPPVHPLVMSRLFSFFFGLGPFLLARLMSAALGIGSVAIFYCLAARLTEKKSIALMLAGAFATAPLMLLGYGWARNDVMAIFFGLCGVWSVFRGFDTQKNRFGNFLYFFLGGFCMALAVGTKLTAVFIPLTALFYVAWRSRAAVWPLVTGGAAGSAPLVYYSTSGFDKFFYCIVTLHLIGPPQYYSDVGQSKILTLPYRLGSMAMYWADEPALVAATLFIGFLAFAAWRRHCMADLEKYLVGHRIFVILLMVAAIPFVLLPNPAGKPYLQPVVPYVLLTCAALYPLAGQIFERRQLRFFAVLAGSFLALQTVRFVLQDVLDSRRPLWTPAEVHDLSKLIAGHVKLGVVASLYPALVLDAGTAVNPVFASGVYFFRWGNHLPPERVLELKGMSPDALPLALDRAHPAAIFIGDTAVDQPLLNWAKRNCYNEVSLTQWRGGPYIEKFWKPRLFLRPDEAGPCSRP